MTALHPIHPHQRERDFFLHYLLPILLALLLYFLLATPIRGSSGIVG